MKHECVSCSSTGKLVYFLRALYCLECRAKIKATFPELPPVSSGRRQVTVEFDGKKYTFGSKEEARRVLRRLTGRKRLPKELAEQLR